MTTRDSLRRQGEATRRRVFGDDDGAPAYMRTVNTEATFGALWSRPGLDRKTRSMLAIALLAALGHHEELKLHVRATRNTGVSRDEVKEVLLQTAVYAGVPAANSAFKDAREAYRQLEEEEHKP